MEEDQIAAQPEMSIESLFEELRKIKQNIIETKSFDAKRLKDQVESLFKSAGYRDKNISAEDTSSVKNILVINDGSSGDFINFIPSLRYLRQKFPDARIFLIHDSTSEPIASGMNSFFAQRMKTSIPYHPLLPLADQIISSPALTPHIVDQYLELLDGFFGTRAENRELESFYSPSDMDSMIKILSEANFIEGVYPKNLSLNQKLFAVCMGGSRRGNHYPPEKYAALARKISEEIPDARFIILGGSGDVESGEIFQGQFGDDSKILNLTSKTNYRESFAVMKFCEMYIGNDTGTMHAAAADKIPCLAPFCYPAWNECSEYAAPLAYAPYHVPSVIIQPVKPLPGCESSKDSNGCKDQNHPHCITQITVEKMFEGFRLLQDKILRNDLTASYLH